MLLDGSTDKGTVEQEIGILVDCKPRSVFLGLMDIRGLVQLILPKNWGSFLSSWVLQIGKGGL